MKRLLVTLVAFLLASFSTAVYANAVSGPTNYLTEQVFASYKADGTTTAQTYSQCPGGQNPCKFGYVEVSIPNAQSVLQFVRVNVSNRPGTDLQTAANFSHYSDVAVSTTANSRFLLRSNTTANTTDYYFRYTATPTTLVPNMTHSNLAGGQDAYSSDNIRPTPDGTWPDRETNKLNFTFGVRNNGTVALNNIVLTIQFALNTGPSNQDAVSIINSGAQVPTTSIGSLDLSAGGLDSDSDTYNDRLIWTGNLAGGATVTIRFNATLNSSVNFAPTVFVYNLDTPGDEGTRSNWSETSTSSAPITGRIINNNFSRSSIRQGVELLQKQDNTWRVRGFITNIDEGVPNLSYYVNNWALYLVHGNGSLASIPNVTGSSGQILTSSGRYNTNWFDLLDTSKPFYASEFNWWVLWNDTNNRYAGFVNTTMNMSIVHKIDLAALKDNPAGFFSPDTGSDKALIRDRALHTGSNGTNAENIEINSIVPYYTTLGADRGALTINDVNVFFVNRNGVPTNITSGITIDIVTPSTTANGYVRVRIPDLSSTNIGADLRSDERVDLLFNVTSTATMTSGDAYRFTGNTTFITVSGTPITENSTELTISVVGKRLTGFKDLIAKDPLNPTRINSTIKISVEDSASTGGITGIIFTDYIPEGATDFNETSVTLRLCSTPASCVVQTRNVNYVITNRGLTTLPGGVVARIFEYNTITGNGWHLNHTGEINVTYGMNINTTGAYILPTVIAGFDPDTGVSLSTTTYGIVRVVVPEISLPLQIVDEELTPAKRPVTFKPNPWSKRFEVFNPNDRQVRGSFESLVFPDAIEGYVSYIDYSGRRIEEPVTFEHRGSERYMVWESMLNPLETRIYDLTILTPPVVEVDRDVEVLEELSDKKVRLKLDVFLKNLAEEDYDNVILNLPIPFESIESVTDGFGNVLAFTGGRDSSSIAIDKIEGKGVKTVTVVYTESFPAIIITPDKDRYDLSSNVGLDILIINGGEELEHPAIEIEVYDPNYNLIFADIRELETIASLEKTQLYQRFNLPSIAPDGFYIIVARFRESGEILTTFQGQFYVAGIGGGGLGTLNFAIITIVGVVLIYLLFRRVRETRREKGVEESVSEEEERAHERKQRGSRRDYR